MLKYFILIFVFGYRPCTPWHYETYNQKWTLGSAVNVTVGPPNIPFCKVTDNKENVVFNGLGPCRIVLDEVTMEHEGRWLLWYAFPDEVAIDRSSLDVKVRDIKPLVSSDVVKNGSSVTLTCSVPVENQVQACLFRDSEHYNDLIATSIKKGRRQNTRYETYVEQNTCTLRLLKPNWERPGIWRCAVYVNATQEPSYDFISISAEMLDFSDNSYNYLEPSLTQGLQKIGNDGEVKMLTCSIGGVIRYCYFRSPNGTIFNVSPLTSSAGYEYVGSGFDAGECGIKFDSPWTMKSDYYDTWTCNVGLVSSYEEYKTYFFVNKYTTVDYFWNEGSVVISMRIDEQISLNVEYCRFIRSDGLSFTNKRAPRQYQTEIFLRGICDLTILEPASEYDSRTWTIIAKLKDREELSTTITWEFESNTVAIILWSVFGTLSVFLVVPLLFKKNRQWTYQKASSIGSSIRNITLRRQKHSQPLNVVTDPPRAGYTHI